MIPPKVFISYSHDSATHKKWVLEFATTLRDRGVDAILDQWDLKPGDDLSEFMEQNLEDSEMIAGLRQPGRPGGSGHCQVKFCSGQLRLTP